MVSTQFLSLFCLFKALVIHLFLTLHFSICFENSIIKMLVYNQCSLLVYSYCQSVTGHSRFLASITLACMYYLNNSVCENHASFLTNTKKILNIPITIIYNGDDVNVIKTWPTSFNKKHNLLHKQCQQM